MFWVLLYVLKELVLVPKTLVLFLLLGLGWSCFVSCYYFLVLRDLFYFRVFGAGLLRLVLVLGLEEVILVLFFGLE